MRIVQPAGDKGSLKWMQLAVAHAADLLQPGALPRLTWVSPLASDGFAEYRDAAFLERLGLGQLAGDLAEFWPRRGPQWDGLAVFDGGVVLAEAKAHLVEFDSTPCAAGAPSLARIRAAFARMQTALGLPERDWHRRHYQYANRLAHLWWLRAQGVDAHLLLIGFRGDTEVNGPADASAWRAVHESANAALGLTQDLPLLAHVHAVFPDVTRIARPAGEA